MFSGRVFAIIRTTPWSCRTCRKVHVISCPLLWHLYLNSVVKKFWNYTLTKQNTQLFNSKFLKKRKIKLYKTLAVPIVRGPIPRKGVGCRWRSRQIVKNVLIFKSVSCTVITPIIDMTKCANIFHCKIFLFITWFYDFKKRYVIIFYYY